MKITQTSYWEKINTIRKQQTPGRYGRIRSWWGRPPSREIFDRLCDQFFKIDSRKKVLEIGCAPAKRLLDFAKRYQYIPYGVEYTRSGVEATQNEFKKIGIPEKHCIFSDIFEKSFQNAYKNKFDIVISFGFIEHFTNAEEVVDIHLNLLKEGGMILIMIPNLRGIYYPLTKIFAPELISIHNLNIMSATGFNSLFSKEKVETLFLGRYGVLNFGMLQARGKFKNFMLKILQRAQTLFNPVLRQCHRLENRLTSPYHLFIGRKPISKNQNGKLAVSYKL